MQGRQAIGLTQKDLATRMSEKPSVIQDYEVRIGAVISCASLKSDSVV